MTHVCITIFEIFTIYISAITSRSILLPYSSYSLLSFQCGLCRLCSANYLLSSYWIVNWLNQQINIDVSWISVIGLGFRLIKLNVGDTSNVGEYSFKDNTLLEELVLNVNIDWSIIVFPLYLTGILSTYKYTYLRITVIPVMVVVLFVYLRHFTRYNVFMS